MKDQAIRRGGNDTLISLGGVGVLLLGLAAMDERVREQIASIVRPDGSSVLTRTASALHEIVAVAYAAVRHQSLEHAPLTVFVVIAAVLVWFMLKT